MESIEYSKIVYDNLTDKDLGFEMLSIGKPGSGKTTFIKKMISSKKFYDYIFLISPSAIEYPEIPTPQKTTVFTTEFIIKAINMVNSAIGTGREGKVLIILDDCIAEIKKLNNDPKVVGLFFNRRHLLWNGRIDLIISSQKYTMLPAKFRSCITDLLIFGVSPFDMKKIIDESTMLFTKREWIEKIKQIYEKEHGALYINIDRQLFLNI